MKSYLMISEVADLFSVSISTIRNWIKSGHIPSTAYVKVGSTYRFNLDKVEAALLEVNEPPPLGDVTQTEIEQTGAELDALATVEPASTSGSVEVVSEEESDDELRDILSDYEDDL